MQGARWPEISEATARRLGEGRWRAEGACAAFDPGLWWPERRVEDPSSTNTLGTEAKVVCESCPVRVECLVDALVRREQCGIQGGAGGLTKKALRRALVGVEHDPLESCGAPSCTWCPQLADHWRRLADPHQKAGIRGVSPVNSVGLRSTHGRRTVYVKGCRCAACRFSASPEAMALWAAGTDTAWYWVTAMGGLDVDDPVEALAARLVATTLASARLGEISHNSAAVKAAKDLAAAVGVSDEDVDALVDAGVAAERGVGRRERRGAA